jgi:polysaccharide export outer membrane protein
MTTLIRTSACVAFLVVVSPAWGQTLRPPAQPAPTTPSTAPQPASAPASLAVPTRAAAEVDQYKIGPEDSIDISVWKNPDLTRTVVVRPDGKISLPLLHDVQAAGLTPVQLQDALTRGYSAFQPEPEVAVIVREIHSMKVSVMGGVKTPGRYELKSRTTVLEALALAGGFTDFAKKEQIIVYRNGARGAYQIPFNYSKVAIAGQEENFFLQPGDIIVVPN